MTQKKSETNTSLILMWGIVIGIILLWLVIEISPNIEITSTTEELSCFDQYSLSWDCKYVLEGMLIPETNEYGKYWHCLKNTTPYEETNILYTVRAC